MQIFLMLTTFVVSSSLFSKLDKNSDGRLVKSELSPAQAVFFDRALRVGDQDFDGTLTVQELAVALREPKQMVGQRQRQRNLRPAINPASAK